MRALKLISEYHPYRYKNCIHFGVVIKSDLYFYGVFEPSKGVICYADAEGNVDRSRSQCQFRSLQSMALTIYHQKTGSNKGLSLLSSIYVFNQHSLLSFKNAGKLIVPAVGVSSL